MTDTTDLAALVRAAASFVRDTYSGDWADDAAATLEADADRIERGEPCSLLRLADTMRSAVPAVVQSPADGDDAQADPRRRIYLDGAGNAWLSLSHDRGIQYIGKLAGAFDGDDTTTSVRERTGSLREIGRCW